MTQKFSSPSKLDALIKYFIFFMVYCQFGIEFKIFIYAYTIMTNLMENLNAFRSLSLHPGATVNCELRNLINGSILCASPRLRSR